MNSTRIAPLTPIQRRIIVASAEIMAERTKQIDFLHTVQCQCVLPYRNPGDQVRTWDRKQGHASLRIDAGAALDPKTGKYVDLGLPYGEKPRLVLIHLASEAIRTDNPVIDVEGSMTAFARSLGMETNGQQIKDLKSQLTRLAAATVRMGMVQAGRVFQVNTQIVTAFDLWYPEHADQKMLWPSTVRLGLDFFQSLERHAVPLDHRAVRAIAHRRSPSTPTPGWPNACIECQPASRSSSPGRRSTSSSARASPASATSAAGSSKP